MTRKPLRGYYRYGYYWGPGYSAGQYLRYSANYKTLPGAPTPIDWNDRSAAIHDAAYNKAYMKGDLWYGSKNLENADYKFAWRGLRAGFHSKGSYARRVTDTLRGVLGAAAVGGQGVTRRIYRMTHKKPNK